MNIPTPHIEVTEKNKIAKTVLMPGDPLRAKYIAEIFLNNAVLFNSVRNIFGYTGTYKNKTISVMASGMGMPSMGIYSYELFAFYEVENIIRIGSCGAYTEDLKLLDLVLSEEVYSESTYALVQSGDTRNVLHASAELNETIIHTAAENKINLIKGRVHSSDVFYQKDFKHYEKVRDEHACMVVEMEAFALFANAQLLNKKATTLLSVTDHLVHHQSITAMERQEGLNNMITLALESCMAL